MRFIVDAVHGRGTPQAIEVEARTHEEARGHLAHQGYVVLGLRAVGWRLPRVRRDRFATVVFIEQLRDLLQAGLSVVEALTTLQQSADESGRPVLAGLVRRLRGGETLSQAMSADARFPPLLVSLVQASELTSDLQQALSRFLEHEQRVAEVRHRITSVAIYPLALVAVGAGVLAFLMFYVMPRFARVFDGMNGELPWSARAMVWWARWLASYWPGVAGALVVAGLALVAVIALPSLRLRAGTWLLAWEPLRVRLRLYFLSRWFRATGMLVAGGIPLPQALGLARGVLPSALRAAGAAVERSLRDGHSPAQAFSLAGMATPVAEQLIRAGERTGDLGSVLTRVATFHETEVARTLERGMRSLEPVVMVLVGVGVGVVVVLMYMPIFELAAAIQ
jgi:general secretion pathway protein F